MKDFTLIELLIVIWIIGILAWVFLQFGNKEKERVEFMEYCQSKGSTAEDCKWEWKRLKNGEKADTMFIIPLPMRF
jgi:prepilin-type N-terminal cleavage/methylation domain-containing protein